MEKFYVPYETALRLKEKGFDEDTIYPYVVKSKSIDFNRDDLRDGSELWLNYNHKGCMDIRGEVMCAPTYDQVEDWFLEKHNIDFEIDLFFSQHPSHYEGKWHYEGYDAIIWKNKEVLKDLSANTFVDKRSALSFAFEEALKLV